MEHRSCHQGENGCKCAPKEGIRRGCAGGIAAVCIDQEVDALLEDNVEAGTNEDTRDNW